MRFCHAPGELADVKIFATERLVFASPSRLIYDRRMIRQAVASDAEKAVPLVMQAIGHIAFVLTGTTDSQEAASILSDFFGQEDNRISYQNALVMKERRGAGRGGLSSTTAPKPESWMHPWSALPPISWLFR